MRSSSSDSPRHSLNALRPSAPNAFKQFSAPFGFADAGTSPAVVASTLKGTVRSSRWVKSSRGGQLRRCVTCSQSWALGCVSRSILDTQSLRFRRHEGKSHGDSPSHGAMGRELEAQRLDAADGQTVQTPQTAKSLAVGIDDTYVKHREPLVARQLSNGGPGRTRWKAWRAFRVRFVESRLD
jgi:hypothetical protein